MNDTVKNMHTYFVYSPKLEAVKIGRSINVTKRLQAIRNGNPDELRILGTIEGDHELEFHQRFAGHRTKGEWFSLGPALIDYLKAEFKIVLEQKKRPINHKRRHETWPSIVDRAEKLFGCGLRHTEYEDFSDAMNDAITGRVGELLIEGWKEGGEWDGEYNDDQIEELTEATEPGDWIAWKMEKWWPWVMGWNINEGGYLDVHLLFKRPDQARLRENLLWDLSQCGYLADEDDVDFVGLNVGFCWRSRNGDELVGEIVGPEVVDDCVEICWKDRFKVVVMDEIFGFKLMGDLWYRQYGLPTPTEAKEMSCTPS
jgi:Meiotically up-regulated gene 113